MLVERLNPIKERLQEQMGFVEWGTLILQVIMCTFGIFYFFFFGAVFVGIIGLKEKYK